MVDAMLNSEPLPPSRNRQSWVRRVVGIAVILGVIGVVIWAFTLIRSTAEANDYPGPGGEVVTIVVKRGDSLTAIARTLQEADVVRSVDAFLSAAREDARTLSIGPGQYALPTQIPAVQAVEFMLDPATRAQNRVVVPEGLRLDQTVETLVRSTEIPRREFRQILRAPSALGLPDWAADQPEGFLFPATYDFAGDESAEAILRTLVRRFDQAAATVDLVGRAADIGRSPYEIVIIASLIEAEVAPDDFGKAARVVYNRLEAAMPLQFDATVGYALGINELLLTREQLDTDSPYNTYKIKGLPPTPINSPGEAALEAALQPDPGPWLYFVSTDPAAGITKFTDDYDEFLQFKREFQRNVRP